MPRTAEIVQGDADLAEQSWQFEQPPGTTGDLTIAVGTTGLDYIGATSDGLRLRRPDGVDVGYSHGTWIDASGIRSPVPAVFDRRRILLTVPAAVVADSVFPAVLDPVIVIPPSNDPGAQ